MKQEELKNLVNWLLGQPNESEIIEYKANFHSENEIGERISALANSACLIRESFAYMVFGIEDGTKRILGTNFDVSKKKIGNELLESWLMNRLEPRIDYRIYRFEYSNDTYITLIKIPTASAAPVKFNGVEYIRIGSTTQKLARYPEKEKHIWRNLGNSNFLKEIAKERLSVSEVSQLLSTETYFDMMGIPKPQNLLAEIDRFVSEGFVQESEGTYSITNLGALLFAKDMNTFPTVSKKAVRVISYKGNNKLETLRDIHGQKGYAIGFEGVVSWVSGQLPENEEIGKALRKEVKIYPPIAIRELIANALIHQDFYAQGCPTIEIYSDRLEISNPGKPIIQANRFIDEYQSRNEELSDVMRRLGVCEEKGSGMDKVIASVELFQLPPIDILVQENRTIVSMYVYKTLGQMDNKEKVQACYQHACLKYVSNESMTNQSLRKRFGIDDKNAAIASRILKDAINSLLIKEEDPDSGSRKFKKYLPFWA